MDVIMPSIHSLLPKLKTDYPQFHFDADSDFRWSPSKKTVFYDKDADDMWVILIHELAHGLLEHTDYSKDVQLLNLERQAWEKALEVAKTYNETIDEDTIESHLDTYRDWLHTRSTCPECKAVGLQIKRQVYHCPACSHEWRVNEARTCALRRYSLK
jgi:Zn finger protein HypA/HybF involved in hydrogenase expression